jgi:hypothetical protein
MGGAGGHMRHPHDLNEVEDGQDVVNLFKAIPAYLKTKEFQGGASSSLKVDGSNNGLKVVVRNGDYTFAVDRGTQMAADVAGVSLGDMDIRWPEKIDPATGEAKPRGLMGSSIQLVTMMNEALAANRAKMVGLLTQLGLLQEDGYPDLSKFIMIEWVERRAFDHPTNPDLGRANVIYYPYDFIAFLGVNQFFEMTNRHGEVTRPSDLKATEEDSGPGKPASYDREALSELVEMVKPFAPEGFEVLSPISLKVAVGGDVPEEEQEAAVTEAVSTLAQNIDATLQEQIPIRLHSGDDRLPTTHTLEEWLGMAENFPYKPDIKIKQMVGEEERIRKVSPFHKDIHKALFYENVALPDLVVDTEIAEAVRGDLTPSLKALYGAIFIEAARRLGNTVKQSLGSSVEEFGPTVSHEGVVIDAGMKFGDKKTGHPFKITGEFIVDATGGAYAGGQALEEQGVDLEVIEDEGGDPVVDVDAAPQTVALVPGAFKPPHKGHADMVRAYATGDGVPKADRTIILISNPEGALRSLPHDSSEVNAEHSRQIWETVFSDVTSLPGVEIEIASSDMRSPVSIAYEYISETTPLDIRAGDNVILGASRKDRDYERWKGATEYHKKKQGVNVLAGEEYAVEPSERSDGKNFSASDSRQLISNLVTNPEDMESLRQLTEYIPQDKIDELYRILGQPSPVSPEPPEEAEIEIIPPEESELEELSAVGAGAIEGPGGRRKKKSIIRRENKQTVDDVIRLLMERGIMT